MITQDQKKKILTEIASWFKEDYNEVNYANQERMPLEEQVLFNDWRRRNAVACLVKCFLVICEVDGEFVDLQDLVNFVDSNQLD